MANGVYFYIIESSAGKKASGKIAVRILTMFFLIPFAILAEEGDGGQAGAFLRIPINARANGMGRMDEITRRLSEIYGKHMENKNVG